MAFLRAMGLLLVVLLALYAVLSVWLRLRERRRLAEAWETEGGLAEREAFVRAGMAAYDRSFGRRLLWLVVVGPMAGFLLLLYLLNMS